MPRAETFGESGPELAAYFERVRGDVRKAFMHARSVRTRRRASGGGLAPSWGGAGNGAAGNPAGQRAEAHELDGPSGHRAGPGPVRCRSPHGTSALWAADCGRQLEITPKSVVQEEVAEPTLISPISCSDNRHHLRRWGWRSSQGPWHGHVRSVTVREAVQCQSVSVRESCGD